MSNIGILLYKVFKKYYIKLILNNYWIFKNFLKKKMKKNV